MFGAIFRFIAALPKLLDIIRDLYATIKEAWVSYKNEKRKEKLEEGIKHAEETGDTSQIEDLLKNPEGKK